MAFLCIALLATFITSIDSAINIKKRPCFQPEIGGQVAPLPCPELKGVMHFTQNAQLVYDSDAKTYVIIHNNVRKQLALKGFDRHLFQMNDQCLCWIERQKPDQDILHSYFFQTDIHCKYPVSAYHSQALVQRLKISSNHPNMLYAFLGVVREDEDLYNKPARLMLIDLKTENVLKTANISLMPDDAQSCISNFHLVETGNARNYFLYDRYFGARKSWKFDFEEFAATEELPYTIVETANTNTTGALIAIGYNYHKLALCSTEDLNTPLMQVDLGNHTVQNPLVFIGLQYIVLCTEAIGYCNTCKKSHLSDHAVQIFDVSDGKKVFKKTLNFKPETLKNLSSVQTAKDHILMVKNAYSKNWFKLNLPVDLDTLSNGNYSCTIV